jgi:Family of unknown function (DUF5880)
MSDSAAATSMPPSAAGGAESIAAILKSAGPVVKCVLLQHIRDTGRDVLPHPVIDGSELKDAVDSVLSTKSHDASTTANNDNHSSNDNGASLHITKRREVLTELIQEMKVDTTPGKNGVQNVLGGSFTFLGQYPDEGVVLMARADQFVDLTEIDDLSVRELKALIRDNPDITASAALLEKSDLVQAVKEAQLPLNPHKLQPPFDDCAVRGDILIMRVADTPDDEDGDANSNDDYDDPESAVTKAVNDFTSATAVSNEDFFLDYTADEYIAFASRTDVVAPVNDEESEDASDDEDDGDEEDNEDAHVARTTRPIGAEDDDEEYSAEDMLDENVEDDRRILLNLILGEVIKSFRNENHRGPDSEELLDLRRQVAEKLGLELAPPVPAVPDAKRRAVDPSSPQASSPKRVKFSPELAVRAREDDEGGDDLHSSYNDEYNEDEDDRKMAAKPDGGQPDRNGNKNGDDVGDPT